MDNSAYACSACWTRRFHRPLRQRRVTVAQTSPAPTMSRVGSSQTKTSRAGNGICRSTNHSDHGRQTAPGKSRTITSGRSAGIIFGQRSGKRVEEGPPPAGYRASRDDERGVARHCPRLDMPCGGGAAGGRVAFGWLRALLASSLLTCPAVGRCAGESHAPRERLLYRQ